MWNGLFNSVVLTYCCWVIVISYCVMLCWLMLLCVCCFICLFVYRFADYWFGVLFGLLVCCLLAVTACSLFVGIVVDVAYLCGWFSAGVLVARGFAGASLVVVVGEFELV